MLASRPAAADRCPGILRLHEAGDGGLLRVRLPGGRLASPAMEAVSAAASLGNGVVDLTSRANLQVRGLSGMDAEAVADLLWTAGLLPAPEHERVRNVLASPVAGRHPDARSATDPVVGALDRGLCADPRLADLPGRFLFAVDDGSGRADVGAADVGLAAEAPGTFRLFLAGRATSLVTDGDGAAAASALAAAREFLDQPGAGDPRVWRIAQLPAGAGAIAARLGATLTGPAAAPHRVLEPGVLRQRDGRVAVTALAPLGRLDGAMLVGLAGLADQEATEGRVGTDRTITLPDLASARVEAVLARLRALGFVTEAGSGWTRLTACSGEGACANARADVRTAATARAASRGPRAAREHWSGCERGCGAPPGAAVAATAAPGGIVLDVAGQRSTVATVAAALEHLAGAGPTR